MTAEALKTFTEQRSLLFAIAYRMLGTVAVAEDLVQETFTCLKIGVVKTNIRREFPTWMKIVVPLLFDPLLGQTRQEVATSALSLLLDKDFEGVSGALFLKIKAFKRIELGRRVLDPAEGRRLWEFSEDVATHGLKRQPHQVKI